MIALLRGRVEGVRPDSVILSVGGVGFRVFLITSTAEKLSTNEEIELHIHTHVRDDAILLYGFETPLEQEVFETMLGVSGVGPRLGMAILSHFAPFEVISAVTQGDIKRLTKVPGVGKKTAQRLILELKDRFQDRFKMEELLEQGEPAHVATPSSGPAFDAQAALVGLGYTEDEAEWAVGQAVAYLAGGDESAEGLLRLALRSLQPDPQRQSG